MRWSAVFAVLVHLLLRGAAVPHTHGADGHVPEHAARVHVHLTWHGGSHDHHQGHTHHESGGAPRESEPSHGDDVVYLDGVMELAPPKSDVLANDGQAVCFVALAPPAPSLLAVASRRPGAPRPPGDAADLMQTLLPHVLRI